MRFYKWSFIVLILVLAMSAVLTACSTPAATPTTAPSNPNTSGIDGAKLLNDRCTACHTLDRVKSAKQTADQWNQTVTRMIGKGAQLNAEEKTALVAYLAATYK
jgi:hypothetical protein